MNTAQQQDSGTQKKYFITMQANGAYSIYTDTGKESMADERLVAQNIATNEYAERIVTEEFKGYFSYNV